MGGDVMDGWMGGVRSGAAGLAVVGLMCDPPPPPPGLIA